MICEFENHGKRIAVSSSWTSGERAKVAAAIQLAIDSVDDEIAQQTKTIHWNSPSLQRLAADKSELELMLTLMEEGSAEFLELNRSNFGRFISDC